MRRLLDQISGLTSFAISDRICCLHFTNGQHNFQVFSCYMPTSWESGDAAEHVYDLLGMLLLSCDHAGAIQIIGGNFNAVIGNLLPGDDIVICLVRVVVVPEIIEAGCFCGGC